MTPHPLDDCEPRQRLSHLIVLELLRKEARAIRVERRMQREDKFWTRRKELMQKLMDMPKD